LHEANCGKKVEDRLMRTRLVSKPTLQRGAGVSLVAAVACALAGDASASRSQPEHTEGKRELAARIDAVAEKLRSADPTLQRKLPPSAQIAQWRNR
jgi:hypothetical protein